MITTANITMQFGAKPLFENVSVKFSDGNRYGLIGANGSGKSTFMKILGGDLEPTSGNVSVDTGERVGKLRQDQFAFENCVVIDTVMMGHDELWRVKEERDAIYANPDATEADYMHAAELEARFAELDGYSAEARAGELLLGVGIPLPQHQATDERNRAGIQAAECCWHRRCLPIPIFCCWMNRPIISISTPSAGWKTSSIRAEAQSSLFPMIAIS